MLNVKRVYTWEAVKLGAAGDGYDERTRWGVGLEEKQPGLILPA